VPDLYVGKRKKFVEPVALSSIPAPTNKQAMKDPGFFKLYP
jgi:hypothetical protein